MLTGATLYAPVSARTRSSSRVGLVCIKNPSFRKAWFPTGIVGEPGAGGPPGGQKTPPMFYNGILTASAISAINSANDTNTDSDRVTIQKEITQFMDQVNDNALVTFNGKYLLDGSTSEVSASSESAKTAEDEGEYETDAKNFIIEGLASEWVQQSLNLIDETFGIGWTGR